MAKNMINTTDDSNPRSPCPIARTLDIVGDKWTLLVIRDLFLGKTTYGEFQQSYEKIPSNILAERLKRLERYEIIKKTKYQERPVRYAYTLTTAGKTLWPLMKEIMVWGNKHIAGTFDTRALLKKMEAKLK
jgi:DNA-binding HxlR family transcriptional regulator